MNFWLLATAALLLGFVPCGIIARRYTVLDALVALEMASLLAVLALLLMAVGFNRAPFTDLALVLAVLSFGGSLVFVRFVERWV